MTQARRKRASTVHARKTFSKPGRRIPPGLLFVFGCAILFLVIGWITPFVGGSAAAVLSQLSMVRHLDGMARGVVDTNDLVFYLNLTVFFLFLCGRVLDSARWRS